jgi:peptide deformylase
MAQPPDPPDHAPHGPLPEGGTIRPMTRWGTPVMHRAQQSVTSYDDDLRALVADMVATMYAADGVGLAACQIGIDLTLPEGRERKLDVAEEGCLSFPGAFVDCPRPDFATVSGTGATGEPVTFSGDGLLARCLQHETDHTRGTVFGDRLSSKLRKKLQKQHDQAVDDYPADWPLEDARADA